LIDDVLAGFVEDECTDDDVELLDLEEEVIRVVDDE